VRLIDMQKKSRSWPRPKWLMSAGWLGRGRNGELAGGEMVRPLTRVGNQGWKPGLNNYYRVN